MYHKKDSVEKTQKYFGITEQLKNDAANFFVYIQPKLGKIYDESVRRGLREDLNFHDIRDKHLSHLSTLLTGGIDRRFIEESCLIWKTYAAKGVTMSEYIRLYQLLMSYFSGEAHKKHWWRYKRYRNVSRAVRNLLLFDLAVGTDLTEASVEKQGADIAALNKDDANQLYITLEEMTQFIQQSHHMLQEAYELLQGALDMVSQARPESDTMKAVDKAADANNCVIQPTLFANEGNDPFLKKPGNHNHPVFLDVLTQTHQKIQAAAKLVHSGAGKNKQNHLLLDQILDEVNTTLHIISNQLLQEDNIDINTPSRPEYEALYSLLQRSSKTIETHLHHLEQKQVNFQLGTKGKAPTRG